MKKTISLVILLALLVACSGDRGPMGPQGPEGPAGVNILGQVFEVNVNFTPPTIFQQLLIFQKTLKFLRVMW